MILVILVIAALLAFITGVYIKDEKKSALLGGFFILVTLISVIGIVANDVYHVGMKEVTETKTNHLVSVAPTPGIDILMYKNIGTDGKNKVYIYKTFLDEKKPETTKAELFVKNNVKNSNEAKIVTKSTYYEYKNNLVKVLFGISESGHKLIKQTNTFEIPSNWKVISTDQAKQLQK